jgi:hypothetical protein
MQGRACERRFADATGDGSEGPCLHDEYRVAGRVRLLRDCASSVVPPRFHQPPRWSGVLCYVVARRAASAARDLQLSCMRRAAGISVSDAVRPGYL